MGKGEGGQAGEVGREGVEGMEKGPESESELGGKLKTNSVRRCLLRSTVYTAGARSVLTGAMAVSF